MKGLEALWRRLSLLVLLIWVTGSFAFSQGVSWEIAKPLGRTGEIASLWGLIGGLALSLGTLLLALTYAMSKIGEYRAARIPPMVEELDATAGRKIFVFIQGVGFAVLVLWPIYCEGHFLDKIRNVTLRPCVDPGAQACEPDFAREVGQWTLVWRPTVHRFGAEAGGVSGVDFWPAYEPFLLWAVFVAVMALLISLIYLVLRPVRASDGSE